MSILKLIPAPQVIEHKQGCYECCEFTVFCEEKHDLINTSIEELNGRIAENQDCATVKFLDAEFAPVNLKKWAKKEEGYVLVIDFNGIYIYSSTPAGFLYGSFTLKQLKVQFGQEFPCLQIGDAPDLKHRGQQVDFVQGHTEYRGQYMKYLVRELAKLKINALYLYLETHFSFPSVPHLGGANTMTVDDARELDIYCKAYNITLIPALNMMAHNGELLGLQKYQALAENPQGIELDGNKYYYDPRIQRLFSMCPSQQGTREVLEKIFNDICSCFSSPIIHVGGDEVEQLGSCPVCSNKAKEIGRLGIYLEHYLWVLDLAKKQGRKIGIWGDMILHYINEVSEEKRETILSRMTKDCIIYDWHYSGTSRKSLDFFTELGFETVASSSNHQCYTSSVCPDQRLNQEAFFKDAIEAKCFGGMTTSWVSSNGIHEELYNYLTATGAAALWRKPLVSKQASEEFDSAYCLQIYGLEKNTLAEYIHTIGDINGPILKNLHPAYGVSARSCIYHTDNVLTVWKYFCSILHGENLNAYSKGIEYARELWNAVEKEKSNNRYIEFLEGPLLTHEHLLRRYKMSERLYEYYDKAACIQYEDNEKFRYYLRAGASILESHINDFGPIEKFANRMHQLLGQERAVLKRLSATKEKIIDLKNFLLYLSESSRPLPAFQSLHDVFLDRYKSHWFVDRSHDWINGPEKFVRYSVDEDAWIHGKIRILVEK